MVISAFGDSNTYGYDPRLGGSGRYPHEIRWTGRLDELSGISVKNYGHNGECIPGNAQFISSRCAADKPDYVTVMYGTNDILLDTGIRPEELKRRMRAFLTGLAERGPDIMEKVILISPPPARIGMWTNPQVVEKSKMVAAEYMSLADELSLLFADAAEWEPELCFDGVHLSEKGHGLFFEGIREFCGKG